MTSPITTLFVVMSWFRTVTWPTPSLFYTSRVIGHGNAENIVHDDRLWSSQPAFQYRPGTLTSE